MTNLLDTIKEKGKKTGLKVGTGLVTGTMLIGGVLPNVGCVTPAYFFTPSFLLTESDKDSIKRYREKYETPREKTFEERIKERYDSGYGDLFFTCRYHLDDNNNGIAEFTDFKGVTNHINGPESCIEPYCNVVVIRGKFGLLKQDIINPRGRYVLNSDGRSRTVEYHRIHPPNDKGTVLFFRAAIQFDENDCPGVYKYRYFLDEEFIGQNNVYIGR